MKNRLIKAIPASSLTIFLCLAIYYISIHCELPGTSVQAADDSRAAEAHAAAQAADMQAPAGRQAASDSRAAGQLLLYGGVQTFCEQITPIAAPPEKVSEYADFAIADVINYVNVRKEPTTDSPIVGKIYNGAVAHVLATAGEAGDWFQMVSGNVEGYIKAEFFFYGEAAAAVIDDYVTRYAVVQASRLNVRKEPSVESQRIGYIDNGERALILENLGEWLKIQYANNSIGYIAAEYASIVEEFSYAKTLEEEAQELAKKRELEARKKVPEKQAAENVTVNVAPPPADYASNEELRQQIIAYSMQFLGNKYVHGGQSLSGGTDCSGFTSLIYAEFGYSLSRTPGGQFSGNGRSVSYSDARPGDIICYGYGQTCTHVALYLGNDQIIHSANPKQGVVAQNCLFDTIIAVKSIVD